MVTIKTRSSIITIDSTVENAETKVATASPSVEQLYIKFADGLELHIPYNASPQINAAANLLTTANTKNVIFDMNNLQQPIALSN